jgi:hypothetical protein
MLITNFAEGRKSPPKRLLFGRRSLPARQSFRADGPRFNNCPLMIYSRTYFSITMKVVDAINELPLGN